MMQTRDPAARVVAADTCACSSIQARSSSRSRRARVPEWLRRRGRRMRKAGAAGGRGAPQTDRGPSCQDTDRPCRRRMVARRAARLPTPSSRPPGWPPAAARRPRSRC